MRCRAVRKHLVALEDGELSPGLDAVVSEHLETCPRCAREAERLAGVSPRPFLRPTAEARADMARQVDQAVDRAWRDLESRARSGPAGPRLAWLGRETRIPLAATVAYALLLVLSVAWGLHNWVQARSLEVALQARGPEPADEVAPSPLAADQYRPASWTPGDAEDVADTGSDVF